MTLPCIIFLFLVQLAKRKQGISDSLLYFRFSVGTITDLCILFYSYYPRHKWVTAPWWVTAAWFPDCFYIYLVILSLSLIYVFPALLYYRCVSLIDVFTQCNKLLYYYRCVPLIDAFLHNRLLSLCVSDVFLHCNKLLSFPKQLIFTMAVALVPAVTV